MMKKILYSLLFIVPVVGAYADDNESSPPVVNLNSQYIDRWAYSQDPYICLPSLVGKQIVSESQMANQNVAQRWFADGTWNVYSGATASYNGFSSSQGFPNGNGYPIYAYGTNVFAQTGYVAGFSFGGMVSLANPIGAGNMNGYHENGNPFVPANAIASVPEAFIEYMYQNLVQVDVGYIGITNSPWLGGTYYSNQITPFATYQGAMVNVYPGAGWLLTAIAFNAAQFSGNLGFNSQTLYNKGVYDGYSGIISNANVHDGSSAGTVALGANYMGWGNNYNARLWAYQFENYGTLLYADNSLKLTANKDLAFNFAAQGGTDNQVGGNTNALVNNSLGQISSNFVGGQIGATYDWASLNLSFDSIWGPQTAYGGGGIVSPYTFADGLDPLYAEGWITNLVNMGIGGTIYKINPSFSFLDNNLTISPAFTTLVTGNSQWSGTNEAFATVSYSLPQVRGLTVWAQYAYQWVPQQNTTGDNWGTQLFVSYNY